MSRPLIVVAILLVAAAIFAGLVIGAPAACWLFGARMECVGSVCWCER